MSQSDQSMVAPVTQDQSMAPSHLQYAPIPQPDQSLHSLSSTHLQYTPAPVAPPQEEQSNLLISFD